MKSTLSPKTRILTALPLKTLNSNREWSNRQHIRSKRTTSILKSLILTGMKSSKTLSKAKRQVSPIKALNQQAWPEAKRAQFTTLMPTKNSTVMRRAGGPRSFNDQSKMRSSPKSPKPKSSNQSKSTQEPTNPSIRKPTKNRQRNHPITPKLQSPKPRTTTLSRRPSK